MDIAKDKHLRPLKLAEILQQGQEIKDLLLEMETELRRYNGLAAQSRVTFDRLKWDNATAEAFRHRLDTKINVLNNMYLTIIMSAQFKLQQAMDGLVRGVQSGRTDVDSISSLTVEDNTEASEAAWKLIRRDLGLQGISSDVVEKNRDMIVDRIAETVSELAGVNPVIPNRHRIPQKPTASLTAIEQPSSSGSAEQESWLGAEAEQTHGIPLQVMSVREADNDSMSRQRSDISLQVNQQEFSQEDAVLQQSARGYADSTSIAKPRSIDTGERLHLDSTYRDPVAEPVTSMTSSPGGAKDDRRLLQKRLRRVNDITSIFRRSKEDKSLQKSAMPSESRTPMVVPVYNQAVSEQKRDVRAMPQVETASDVEQKLEKLSQLWKQMPNISTSEYIGIILRIDDVKLGHHRLRTFLKLLRAINNSLLGNCILARSDLCDLFGEAVQRFGYDVDKFPPIDNLCVLISVAHWLGDVSVQRGFMFDAVVAWYWAAIAARAYKTFRTQMRPDLAIFKIYEVINKSPLDSAKFSDSHISYVLKDAGWRAPHDNFYATIFRYVSLSGAEWKWGRAMNVDSTSYLLKFSSLLEEHAPQSRLRLWPWRYDPYFWIEGALACFQRDVLPLVPPINTNGDLPFSLLSLPLLDRTDFRTHSPPSQFLRGLVSSQSAFKYSISLEDGILYYRSEDKHLVGKTVTWDTNSLYSPYTPRVTVGRVRGLDSRVLGLCIEDGIYACRRPDPAKRIKAEGEVRADFFNVMRAAEANGSES